MPGLPGRRAPLLALLALLVLTLGGARLAAQPPGPAAVTKTFLPLVAQPSPQPGVVSFWGMNLYLSKRERRNAGDNRAVLGQLARAAGVQWTREELPWDLIEPRDDQFSTVYDGDLLLKLAHDENRCVIVVTHDLSVMDRADVVYRINDGLLERR